MATTSTNLYPSPSALLGYKKHKVLPSSLRYMLQNHFNYPIEFLDTLDSYYLRYWDSKYFLKLIKDGTVTVEDTIYHIIYKDCSPYSIRKCSQVKLSFRTPAKEYGMESYVLVRCGD